MKEKFYFLKQKFIEVVTIAFLSIPFGLILIFTKQKYWMDDDFFECEDEYELEDELEKYDEISMSDILIAAFQEVRNIFQLVKYYISRYKISKPVQ